MRKRDNLCERKRLPIIGEGEVTVGSKAIASVICHFDPAQ